MVTQIRNAINDSRRRNGRKSYYQSAVLNGRLAALSMPIIMIDDPRWQQKKAKWKRWHNCLSYYLIYKRGKSIIAE